VILFTQALPTFSVLADNYWAPERTKITLLIINFSRSINKNPGDFKYFQEEFQIPGDFLVFPGVVDTMSWIMAVLWLLACSSLYMKANINGENWLV